MGTRGDTDGGGGRRPADALEEYRAKRDFLRTAEPAGEPPPDEHDGGDRFVVQRHRARRRHYDLRLEHDGTLLSWAVPKGPTLDPSARRLAVRVEDHPVEYAEFEGVIPAGEYGGGDVIVWDRGRWTPADGGDVRAQLERGSLHFDVEAEKVRGRFVLTRTGSERGKEQWLLIHKGDDHAEPGWDAEDHPRSVLSGRTNDDVAADPDLTWHSDRPPADAAEPTDRRRFAGAEPAELAELRTIESGGRWRIRGRDVGVSNLDKVLFPARGDDEQPVTKRELLEYHARVAPYLLPYLHDRAVNMHRYPNGAGSQGFWQKAVPEGAPEWIRRWRNPDADPGETEWYSVIDSAPSLVWAANLGGFELHPWLSRTTEPRCPTWASIDIDPGPRTSHEDLLLLVRLHRTALAHLGVDGRPRTSGKRGFQIWIPVAPTYTFDQTRSWVESLSRAIGATVPELVSWKWRKDEREGLARLDYTQNAVNKTLVAPYSVRPTPGATVSVPMEWDELDDDGLTSGRWTIRDVLDRLEERGDPLAPLIGSEQHLPPVGR